MFVVNALLSVADSGERHRGTYPPINFLDNFYKLKTKTFQYFSLALDESTDIIDFSQLIIFIRGIDEKFGITEEVAAVCTLKETTRGEDIFLQV